MKQVKVAIIGAGTAGLSARREIAKVTDDYVVIDSGPMGTTCARVGCMPSKVLIQVANDYANRKAFAQEGIHGADKLSIDRTEAMAYVRSLRDRFVRGVFGSMETWEDKLIRKHATFVDAHTLDCEGEQIKAESIIIATGSTPIIPKPWQAFCDKIVDTDQFFELETLPKRMAVIGLGIIGIELGQAISKLCIETTLIGANKAIGGLSDPAIQDYVASKFEEQLDIAFGQADVKGKTEQGELIVEVNGQEHIVDLCLVSVGRKPNLDSLNLAAAGVTLDERGMPAYCDRSYQLDDQKHLYFVGDANALRPLLHEASDQGRIAGYNTVREEKLCFAKRTLLAVTFSDPNICLVGHRHATLLEQGTKFVTGAVSFEGQGRSIVKHKEQGLLHIYAQASDGKILGAEMQAPDGEHLAHLIAWSIANNMTVFDALAMPFYHPAVEEGVRTALRDAASKVDVQPKGLEMFRCGDTPIR